MKVTAKNRELTDREKKIRTSYTIFMVHEFAESYKISKPEGYAYLKKYGGLDFVRKHWWALHTDHQPYSVRCVFDVCRNNGGWMQ